MKKTKWLSWMLVLVIVVGLLAGCSNDDSSGDTETENTSGESTANAGSAEEYKVILLIPGNLGDKSFFDSANTGMKKLDAEFSNITTKVVEMGTDETNWESALLDASDDDWDLIISGNSSSDIMNTIAEKYPDKRYINFDNAGTDAPRNVYSVSYGTNEASFLGGVLAALVTQSDMEQANEENVIGFMGGMDIPGINDFLVGYIQGALEVDGDIKVIASYAGNFQDPVQGKELALLQYKSGADIVFNCAGQTGLGGIDAAYESGRYALGVDSDQAEIYAEAEPEKAEVIVSSVIKRIDNVIYESVIAAMAGELEFGQHKLLGLADNAVGLAENEYYNSVPEEIRKQVEAFKQQVIDGTIEVKSAFNMTTEEVETYRNNVTP